MSLKHYSMNLLIISVFLQLLYIHLARLGCGVRVTSHNKWSFKFVTNLMMVGLSILYQDWIVLALYLISWDYILVRLFLTNRLKVNRWKIYFPDAKVWYRPVTYVWSNLLQVPMLNWYSARTIFILGIILIAIKLLWQIL